jgi:hypothetical protein
MVVEMEDVGFGCDYFMLLVALRVALRVAAAEFYDKTWPLLVHW